MLLHYLKKKTPSKLLSNAALILLSLFFYACAGGNGTSEKNNSSYTEAGSDKPEQAVEYVINAAASEAKGDYNTAILLYQEALKLDSKPGIYYGIAKNYYALNKLAPALQNAEKAIELDPEGIEYYDLLADIHISSHQNDSAVIALNKIIALDSSRYNAYYQLATLYEILRPAQAIEIYNKILEITGPEWNVLIRTAELNEKLGNMDAARANLQDLLSLDPANTSLQRILRDFYIRAKMYNEALDIVNELIEFSPDDLEAREKKAQIYIEMNDWKTASAEYKHILDQPDVPIDVKIKIAGSFFSQALKDSSLIPVAKSFFTELDKDTLDWQIKMYLGAIAVTEKDDSTAIKNFKIVTELASWNADAWIRVGGLYFDNQRYEESAKVMEQAVQSFPENFAVNLILGLALAQSDKHTEAKPYLKKAVDLNPGDITALSAYGFTLSRLKENDEAVNFLTRALYIKGDDVNLLGTLGMIYDDMEKWTECDSVYERALQIDSANALVNNNYAYSLSERGIKLERALRMAKIAIAADSSNSSYLDTIGWVYFKLRDYPNAKFYMEKAIKTGGESALMLEHLGDIVFMMGEKAAAFSLWQKSLNLDSTNEKLKLKIEKGEI